jgi:hypothetical protein
LIKLQSQGSCLRINLFCPISLAHRPENASSGCPPQAFEPFPLVSQSGVFIDVSGIGFKKRDKLLRCKSFLPEPLQAVSGKRMPFSALTYYEHMLILFDEGCDYAKTEVLPTNLRNAGKNPFPAGGGEVFAFC